MLVPTAKLDFWVSRHYNVLLEGVHGVGKTTIVADTVRRNKLRGAFFSGATMDPFIDFVGVPVQITTPDGSKVIELIRPRSIVDLDPEIIFIDEFNRSHPKVRNAVMELIQFKSINGHKFGNLKMVWAAINPDSDDPDTPGVYDTDRLDPAQRDRFEIHYTVPAECDRDYFGRKYGQENALAAIEFWRTLPEDIQKLISPRRLDYAMKVWRDGGDVKDVLPRGANISRFLANLKAGPSSTALDGLVGKPASTIAAFLADDNNYTRVRIELFTKKKFREELLPYAPMEKIAAQLAGENRLRRRVLRSVEKVGKTHKLWPVLERMKLANGNSTLSQAIQEMQRKVNIAAKGKTA